MMNLFMQLRPFFEYNEVIRFVWVNSKQTYLKGLMIDAQS